MVVEKWLLQITHSFPSWKSLPKSHEVSSCFRWCKLPVEGWLSTQMHTVPRVDNGWVAKLSQDTYLNFYPVLLTAFDFTTWDNDLCNLI